MIAWYYYFYNFINELSNLYSHDGIFLQVDAYIAFAGVMAQENEDNGG